MKKTLLTICSLLLAVSASFAASSAVKSIETPYTVSYVRQAKIGGENVVMATCYNGEVVCIGYDGNILWVNELDGYFNQDMCCYDIDGDGNDEVMCASAEGTLYVLDDNGDELWRFRANQIPLYSVTALTCDGEPVIACGGFDKNIYFLTQDNDLLHTIKSTEYAITKTWGDTDQTPQCSINFLRRIKDANGKDLLGVVGAISTHNGAGALYVMDVHPSKKKYDVLSTIEGSKLGPNTIGYMCSNPFTDGADKVVLGISAGGTDLGVTEVDYVSKTSKSFLFSQSDIYSERVKYLYNFGYRVCHVVPVKGLVDGFEYSYLSFTGTTILALPPSLEWNKDKKVVNCKQSFNDMYVDQDNMTMVLASSQSGGNCVHLVDLTDEGWMDDMKNLTPPGNITNILKTTAQISEGLGSFVKPAWEKQSVPVLLMNEPPRFKEVADRVNKYENLRFGASVFYSHVQDPATWNRDQMSSEWYRKTRHGGRVYDRTEDECVADLIAGYPGMGTYLNKEGVDFPANTPATHGAGHGSDPFFYSPAVWDRVLDAVKPYGYESIISFPETPLGDPDIHQIVMDTMFLHLAKKSKEGHNVKVFLPEKSYFWMANVYMPIWSPLVTGEYADVFIPAMEETSSRVQDISVAARVGLWASGCVNDWSSGSTPDNASHDRSRQNSYQTLPTHFMRHLVYHTSLGATYLSDYPVDQTYMSVLWDMIGTGLIYVPKRDEIVSFSPVHLAMDDPDQELVDESEQHKWSVSLNPETVDDITPWVINHLVSSWTSGPVVEWDFSRYASGVVDRRTNFLPPYPHGLVMFTPGIESNQFRSSVAGELHPIYHDIMKTYHTDGKDYIVNGARKSADTYYKTVEEDIIELSEKLPLTVEGNVAWVTAHSGVKHLRLTLIDAGYLNPNDATALIKFHSAEPVSITDLVTGEKIFTNGESQFEITVPTGMFRFLDIEIAEDLI